MYINVTNVPSIFSPSYDFEYANAFGRISRPSKQSAGLAEDGYRRVKWTKNSIVGESPRRQRQAEYHPAVDVNELEA
jgi:hypothetical protein